MKKVINYKILTFLILFLVLFFFVMCQPVIPPDDNPNEPDRIIEVDEYTTIYDYVTLDNELKVEFNNLDEGDRILILPLNTIVSKDNVTLYEAFDLDVEYEGGNPKNAKSLYLEASYEYIGKNQDLNEEYIKDYIIEEEKSYFNILAKSTTKSEQKIPKIYNLNDIVNFWVIDDLASSSYNDVLCPSTLLYIGTHCYIFFSNDLAENPKASELAAKLGQAFDNNIYDKETSYFGYEYGGDPGIPSEYGGIDRDPKIFVLVESITKNCGGYFSSTNEYPDSTAQTWSPPRRSNEKEMFYIVMTNDSINNNLVPFDTLAHEYHHLIQWTKFYKRLRKDQWSIFSEGFANLAATVCGYGPKIYNFDLIESFPNASFTAWNFTQLPYKVSYAYSSGYAFAEYILRRFGLDFINYFYNGDDVGVNEIEDSLNKVGYKYGYSTLVLDILTSLYLDKDEYSYPSANLYDHDLGIKINSTNKCWYAYGPSFTNGLLKGLKTKFYNSYPQNLNIKLYNYGSDPLEFASGSCGKITFKFKNISQNTIIRVILLKVNAREDPCIDGRLYDWENKNYIKGNDPEADNGTDNTSVDIIEYRGFMQNNILYASLITKTKPETSSSNGVYNIYLDITGDDNFDYVILFLDGKIVIRRRYENGQYLEDKTIFLNNVKYNIDEAVEMKIDLDEFNLTLKSNIRIKFWSYCYKNGDFYHDHTDLILFAR